MVGIVFWMIEHWGKVISNGLDFSGGIFIVLKIKTELQIVEGTKSNCIVNHIANVGFLVLEKKK